MTVDEALEFMNDWTPSDCQADEALNVLADEIERLRVERVDILVLLDDALEDLATAIPYAGEYLDRKWSLSANLSESRRRRALLSPAPTSGVTDD